MNVKMRGSLSARLASWSCACLVVIAAGCGGSTPAPGSDGAATGAGGGPASTGPAGGPAATPGNGLTIEYRLQPDPPISGDNAIDVTVTSSDGSPVTDATVVAAFTMPAMPSMNMPAMRSSAALTHEGAGRYRGNWQLSMSGTWNVVVSVSRGSEELGRRTFSLVAK